MNRKTGGTLEMTGAIQRITISGNARSLGQFLQVCPAAPNFLEAERLPNAYARPSLSGIFFTQAPFRGGATGHLFLVRDPGMR